MTATALFRRMRRSPAARGLAALGSAAAIGQLSSLIAAPVLTRLYTPADYGVFAVFAAVIALVGRLSTLTYDYAIPLPGSPQRTRTLAELCLICVLGTTLGTLVVWHVWGASIAAGLGAPALAQYGPLLAAGVAAAGAVTTLNALAIARRDYARIARAQLVQSLTSSVASIGLGLLRFAELGLLAGNLVSQVAGLSVFVRWLGRGTAAHDRPPRPAALWHEARRYRRFPLFTTWSVLLATAATMAPALVISAFFGSAMAGFFLLAYRLCLLPATVIGNGVSQVFFGESAALRTDPRRLAALAQECAGWLGALSLPLLFGLVAFAPALFTGILGPEWRTAGVVTQVLAVWPATNLVSASLAHLPLVLERQAASTAFGVLNAALRAAALLAGVLVDRPLVAVAAIAVSGAAYNVLYLLWCLSLSGASKWLFAKRLLLGALVAAAPIALGYLVSRSGSTWQVIATAFVAGFASLALSLAVYARLAHSGDEGKRDGEPEEDDERRVA